MLDVAYAIWLIDPSAEYTLTDDKTAIEEWRGKGKPPTPGQLQAAWDAHIATEQAKDSAKAALRQQIIAVAQSAVGVRVDQLTAAQQRALLGLLLYKAGAIADDLTVVSLGEWVGQSG